MMGQGNTSQRISSNYVDEKVFDWISLHHKKTEKLTITPMARCLLEQSGLVLVMCT